MTLATEPSQTNQWLSAKDQWLLDEAKADLQRVVDGCICLDDGARMDDVRQDEDMSVVQRDQQRIDRDDSNERDPAASREGALTAGQFLSPKNQWLLEEAKTDLRWAVGQCLCLGDEISEQENEDEEMSICENTDYVVAHTDSRQTDSHWSLAPELNDEGVSDLVDDNCFKETRAIQDDEVPAAVEHDTSKPQTTDNEENEETTEKRSPPKSGSGHSFFRRIKEGRSKRKDGKKSGHQSFSKDKSDGSCRGKKGRWLKKLGRSEPSLNRAH
eukprot:CAMPEP_0183300982 /NCGR_PEP_ID=MMETSP0160_2-20130417/7223_1 /TAXON_ID=2839 ORGANISM="Odontella Sinensis, Strain Grunow 1884" /NCGR_SAMPLE_ID=MMETSP0160_2 /ASSEMBLY_ACC=CAM_ASM_000250 /LENGTH=270 /DNA_ID=CAMNT_0025463493 /DNA_START=3 /DNA_END=815 /DNA_ORIENTATION=+